MTDAECILAYLKSIGETDPDQVDDILNQCANDAETSKYYVTCFNNLPVTPQAKSIGYGGMIKKINDIGSNEIKNDRFAANIERLKAALVKVRPA